VDSAGNQGNNTSYSEAISADGRFVVFESGASNLVLNDTNYLCDIRGDYLPDENCADVFVHDRLTGVTERVSVDSAGNEADGGSGSPDISADGRFVAFVSSATNLVAGDTNNFLDVFVHDRLTGTTERVSVNSAGNPANVETFGPLSISADGRLVAFRSAATNLVPGDTNGFDDVFVHDRLTGVTERVSVDSAGGQANWLSDGFEISEDGRFVVFNSFATNLVPGTVNGFGDVYVHDRLTGTTERVSVDSLGNEGDNASLEPAISADGRLVAFSSYASNLVLGDANGHGDIFVHDRLTGVTERISAGNETIGYSGASFLPSLGSNGRFVAFGSVASNLVNGDTNGTTDAFVHDRKTGVTTRASVSSAGGQGNGISGGFPGPIISADGRIVAFSSNATNLVPGDTNQEWDAFVRDLGDADGDGQWDPFDPCPTAYDCDADSFDDGIEMLVGTDPLISCGPSAWPPDADDDQDADIGDVIILFSGKILNPQAYVSRSDFDADGNINIGDVIIAFGGTILTSCS
jgi:Tol biopolymer transport system component